MRTMRDQSHAIWELAIENMEKEWAIETLCGEGGCLYCMV